MKKAFWCFRLALWMCRFEYFVRWWDFPAAWKWAHEGCWDHAYEDGYTPKNALQEDMSYL